MRKEILNKIYELKHSSFGDVKIVCKFDDISYELLLMTSDCASDQNLMELIGRWRKENEKWFLSQFNVTIERTTKWFNEKVTGAPDRLLFIIKVNNKYIGHVCLFRFDFESNSCEIDNIVRGETGFPGVMGNAIENMMIWGKNELKLKSYTLKVLSNNERAIKLYKRLGFYEINRIPLTYVQGNDGRELVEAPDLNAEDAPVFYVVMKL